MMFSEREPTLEERQRDPEIDVIITTNLLAMDDIDHLYIARWIIIALLPLVVIFGGGRALTMNISIGIVFTISILLSVIWLLLVLGHPFSLHDYLELRKQGQSTLDWTETIGDIPYITKYFK